MIPQKQGEARRWCWAGGRGGAAGDRPGADQAAPGTVFRGAQGVAMKCDIAGRDIAKQGIARKISLHNKLISNAAGPVTFGVSKNITARKGRGRFGVSAMNGGRSLPESNDDLLQVGGCIGDVDSAAGDRSGIFNQGAGGQAQVREVGINPAPEIAAVAGEGAAGDRAETVPPGIETTAGFDTDVVGEDTVGHRGRRVEIGEAAALRQANVALESATGGRYRGIEREQTGTVGRLVELENAVGQYGRAVAVTGEAAAKRPHVALEQTPRQSRRGLETTNGAAVDLGGVFDEPTIVEGKIRIARAIEGTAIGAGEIGEEDAVPDQGGRTARAGNATSAGGDMAIGNGHTLQHSRAGFAGMESKAPVVTARAALAVDDDRVGVAALGTNGDGLAEKIDIAVARPGEGTVGQGDDVPSHRRGNSRLNGRKVAAAVRMNGPGTGIGIVKDEGQDTQAADGQATDRKPPRSGVCLMQSFT